MENQSGIIFKTEALKNYTQVDQAKTWILEVAGNVTERNLFTDESGSRYIVNLKAVAKDKLAQLVETFKGHEALPIETTSGLFMTASIWKNEGSTPALPMRGEKVKCTVGFVASRDGEEVLRVTNIAVQPAEEGKKLDLSKLFAAASVEADVVEA